MADDARERLIFVHFMHHLSSPMRERLELLQPASLADAITKGERYAARITEDHKNDQALKDKLATMAKRIEAVELMRINPPRQNPPYSAPTKFPQNNAPRYATKPNNNPPTCFFCKTPGHYKSQCPLIKQFTKCFERIGADDNEEEGDDIEADADFQSESAEF
jgi:hypothetical protein